MKAAIENDKQYWEEPKYKKKINDNLDERDSKKVEVSSKKEEAAAKVKPGGLQKFEHNLVLTE